MFALNLCPGPDWILSTIFEVLGPVTYIVEADDGLRWKRHANHLKDWLLTAPSSDPRSAQGAEDEFLIEPTSESHEADSVPAPVSEPSTEEPGSGVEPSTSCTRQCCYSQRDRCPPDS